MQMNRSKASESEFLSDTVLLLPAAATNLLKRESRLRLGLVAHGESSSKLEFKRKRADFDWDWVSVL